MNIGHSARLPYDKCFYNERLEESVSPGQYRIEPFQHFNCDACTTTLGPRSGRMGFGVSTKVGHKVAPSQKLVDLESDLSNRNLKATRCRKGRVNHMDVSSHNLINAPECRTNKLNPQYTRLSHPSYNYRGIPINRFHNLPIDPQANIFYNFATNTSLEAKDNFVPGEPNMWDQASILPPVENGFVSKCKVKCNVDQYCPS